MSQSGEGEDNVPFIVEYSWSKAAVLLLCCCSCLPIQVAEIASVVSSLVNELTTWQDQMGVYPTFTEQDLS